VGEASVVLHDTGSPQRANASTEVAMRACTEVILVNSAGRSGGRRRQPDKV